MFSSFMVLFADQKLPLDIQSLLKSGALQSFEL